MDTAYGLDSGFTPMTSSVRILSYTCSAAAYIGGSIFFGLGYDVFPKKML
jgi:hypothetical protein